MPPEIPTNKTVLGIELIYIWTQIYLKVTQSFKILSHEQIL